MKYISLLIFSCFVSLSFAQKKWYVRSSATGAQNGQNWSDAYTDLHMALDMAKAGDSVWVAAGPYKPDKGGDRTRSFTLKSGVRLFGGFVGNETALAQRDWQKHPVVLSGDVGATGDSTDNSYTILYMAQADSNTVVDGFVFDHGNANYTGADQLARSRYKCGGAIYMEATDGWAYPEVRNCVFQYNYATTHGGAVFVNGAGLGSVAPRFLRCVFKNNRARLDGGAVYRDGSSWAERYPDFGHCDFVENEAGRYGGGLYYSDAERSDCLDLYGCQFLGNKIGPSVTAIGTACTFDLGRMDSSSCLNVSNCTFKNQKSSNETFAVLGTKFLDCKMFNMDSSIFEKNEGIEFTINILTGALRFQFCKFIDTKSMAIDDSYTNLSIYKNTFLNTDTILIIALGYQYKFNNNFIYSKKGCNILRGPGSGGVFFNNTVISEGLNRSGYLLTFTSNHQTYNNLFFCENLIDNRSSQKIPIRNSILVNLGNNTDYINVTNSAGNVDIDHCALYKYDCKQDNRVTCGPNNLLNRSPMFRDSANGDFRLLPCSPLIGAGLNSAAAGVLTDLDGKPRFVGDRIDIGPYETPAFAWAAEPILKPACRDAHDGSAELQTANGCPPFGIQWQKDGAAGSGATGLSPGTYFFEVTDARGQRLRDTLTLPQNPGPVPTATASPLRCGSPAGGAASASATGGVPPVQFLWSNGQTGADLTDLPPGDYRVTATDATGCRDSASAQVARLGALALLVGGKPISCHGQQDGQLSATPLGGKTPFQYQWSNHATDSLLTGLLPGPYAVTVRDAFGCSAEYAFNLHEPDSLWITGSVQDATGPQTPDGGAAVSGINGGTPPFGYGWTTGASTQSITSILPGSYTVTVRDHNGCSVEKTLVVKFMSATGNPDDRALLLLYPNPAVESTTLQGELALRSTGLQLVLYDAGGRQLRQFPVPNPDGDGGFAMPVSLEGLATGIYRAVLQDAEGKVLGTGTLVKI